jgi:hypothetical protein
LVHPQGVKSFDSPNVTDLVNALPFEAPYPIVREIRYTYGSILELKKKEFEPYIVTDEHPDYFEITKQGVAGRVFQEQYNSFKEQGQDWIKRNESNWSSSELASFMSFQSSMEGSMSAVHAYYSIMGAMSGLAYAWTKSEAESLVSWTSHVTRCRGESASDRSVLHLNMMRLTKGERFKFHSSNDFIVTATLELADTVLISTQAMQFWVNTNKNVVSPTDAVPIFQSTASPDKLEILKPVSKNGFTLRFALLINAAIQDIYQRLDQ